MIFVLAVVINFAKHGRSQCLEKLHRNARCHNFANQLHGAQKSINVLKKCLIAEVMSSKAYYTNTKQCFILYTAGEISLKRQILFIKLNFGSIHLIPAGNTD